VSGILNRPVSPAHPDVTLGLAGAGDLPAVGEFLRGLAGPHFEERFPGLAPKDFYRWKYLDNPLGEAVVGVAMAAGRPVSTVAAVPKRLQAGADTLTAYELGDFLTDEAYRRRGLFSRLVEMVCSEAARRKADLVYVRANDNSFPILVKHLGFSEPIRLQVRRYLALGRALTHRYGVPERLVRLSGLDRLSQLALSGPPMRRLAVERVQRFGQATDELWERVRGDYPFLLVRDSEYLNWRFARSPTPYRLWVVRRHGVVGGFLVAFVSPRTAAAYVMDLFTARRDHAAARSLVRACFRGLLQEGVRTIYTWTAEDRTGTASDRALRRACMWGMGPPLHVAVRLLNASRTARRLSAQASHLSAGDFDGG